MFKSFRWQIALWFVGLSFMIYLVLSMAGSLYFYTNFTRSMDEELNVVASQIGHAIDLNGAKPTFRDWLRVVETEPARSIMSIQLFAPTGELLEHYGPVGIPRLYIGKSEISDSGVRMRIRHTRLMRKGLLVGFLQLQLPTDKRYELTREFLLTMAVMAPFVLSGFGLCSYIVSGIAAKPIELLVITLQRFIADAGHELNTPASIVQARAESLERKMAKQGLFEEDIRIIASSAERMGQIVQKLMLLAELDSRHHHQSAKTAIDVAELIHSTAEEFAPQFAEKSINLRISANGKLTILSDRGSMECVLRNLLENALKYTTPNGTVSVACEPIECKACLTVEDTGVGIPKDSLPYIFDRFYRVDRSRSRASGGSGLGLAIVRAIVQDLSGQVQVESQVGQGTRFSIYLPLYKENAVAQKLHTSSK